VKKRIDIQKDRDSAIQRQEKLQEIFTSLNIDDPEKFKLELDSAHQKVLTLKKQLKEA